MTIISVEACYFDITQQFSEFTKEELTQLYNYFSVTNFLKLVFLFRTPTAVLLNNVLIQVTCGVPDLRALLASTQYKNWLNDCLITWSSLWIRLLQQVAFESWAIPLILTLCDEYREIDYTNISTAKYRILETY
jgi:hypothetical protein